MSTYLVQGCGISLVCEAGESMKEWINYIIARGGVPVIQILNGGNDNA